MTERSVFLEALEHTDPGARAAFLDRACAGRPGLRQRVEELLRSHGEADTFLDVPALEQMAAADRSLAFLDPPRAEESLGSLDHYEVLDVVGRGGAGVVLKARDTKLQRIVAIKALAPRLVASPAARARFVREAQAAAAIRDDHVVAIHAVNDDGPVPYLVMEYISGITLEERLRQEKALELKEILRIGIQVAAGLAAAHAQGLVHRDIKPANILLENSVQRVKITDFGLAGLAGSDAEGRKRCLEPSNSKVPDTFSDSESKVLAGTPQYMSPEQASGESADFRSDLFSLGSVLYTLCAGRPPFAAGTVTETLQRVCAAEPPSLLDLKPDVPQWLRQAIGKLHAKQPGDRFGSAQEVADLLSAELARLQQPGTLARRASAGETPGASPSLARRASGRRKVWLVLMCLGLLAAIAGGVYAFVVLRQPQDAEGAPDEKESHPASPIEFRRQDIPPHLLALAGAGDPVLAPPELVGVLGDGRFLLPHVGGTSWIVPSPDGNIEAVPLDEDLVLFETGSGRLMRTFKGPGGRLMSVAFSPDSRLMAATTWFAGFDGTVRVWDLRASREAFTSAVPGYKVSAAVVFSLDGKRLLAEGKDQIHIWDVEAGKELPSQAIRGGIGSMGFSPDGKRLAVAIYHGKRVEILEWHEGNLTPIRTLPHSEPVPGVAYSPDGKYLASGTDSELKLWNAETFEKIRSVQTPAGQVAFSPDNRILYAAHTNAKPRGVHTISRWLVGGGEELPPLTFSVPAGPTSVHHGLSRDGKVWFVARGADATYVQAFDSATGKELYPRLGHGAPLHAVAVSPDGRAVASGGDGRVVRIWDLASRRKLHSLASHTDTIYSLAFSPDGKLLASGSKDGTIQLYDARRGTQVGTLRGHSSAPSRIQFSPDSKTLVAGNESGVVQTWDLATGALGAGLLTPPPGARRGQETRAERVLTGHTGPVRALALSADGSRLASAGEDRTVCVRDLAGGQVRKLSAPPGINDVAFSHDGRLLAAVGDGPRGAVRLWHLESGQQITLDGHLGHVNGLAFSPSAPVLATCGDDGTVRLWDLEVEALVRTMGPGPFGGPVGSVAFTPDGRHLLTANANGMVYVLQMETNTNSH
jgi:WD40 repeat protein/serine/threonine protein kinase